MKTLKLKSLIQEMFTPGPFIPKTGAYAPPERNITRQERNNISNEMHRYPVLQGNQKVHKPSEALKYITKALDEAGFQLDMVTGDILLGDKGNRLLSFSRPPISSDVEGVQIENSRISFSWDVMYSSRTNRPENNFEIIAYVT